MITNAPDFLYRWIAETISGDHFDDGDAVLFSDLALGEVAAAGFDPQAVAEELGADVITIVHDTIDHRDGGR